MLFYRRMDNLVLEERLLGSEAEEQPNLKRRIWVESKLIWRIALPSMLARVTSFGMIVVTQAFLGHIDELELAAFALVQSLVLRFVNGILVCYYYLLRFLKAKLYFYLQILRIVSFDFLGLVGTMFIYSLSFQYLQLQELVITQKKKKKTPRILTCPILTLKEESHTKTQTALYYFVYLNNSLVIL